MRGQIIPPDNNSGQHLVDVNTLPKNVLGAIIRKLNEKTQRSTQSFKDEYIVSISDIKQLVAKLRQELEGNEPISESISVSLHLNTNQRFDFSSWEDFEKFDTSQAERTKSVSFEYIKDFANDDGTLERYKVQVAVQNVPGQYHFFFGPITLRRIEDAGLPPVPIHSSVEYSNYIKGKNLTGTIDSWVKSLDINDRKIVSLLQQNSRKIAIGGQFFATFAAISGSILFIPMNSGSLEEIAYLAGYSAAFIYLAMNLGKILSGMVERNLDRHESQNTISITKGDLSRNRQIEKKNNSVMRAAAFFGTGILIQILCSIAASYIFESIKNSAAT
jgi:hypothetical protein